MQQANNNGLYQWRHKKRLIITLLLTFAINYSLRLLDSNPLAHATLIHKLQTQSQINMEDLLQVLEFQESYQGTWMAMQKRTFLTSTEGLFDMRLIRLVQTRSKSFFELSLRLFDGEYADDGALELQFRGLKKDFNTFIADEKQQQILLKNKTFLEGRFSQEDLLATVHSGPTKVAYLCFSLSLSEQKQLKVKMVVQSQEEEVELVLFKDSRRMFKSMILAIIMFICCFETFSGLFSVVRDASEGGAGRYSLATVCLASMWDTVVCMALLVLAFSSQINLMLFLVPAFLMCLVFTNLQPKLMVLIFQSAAIAARNPQRLLCKFNMLHYGSLFLVYPLVLIANFQPFIFVLATCIFFPQIYLNALTGTRPQLGSHYYRHFLLYRFVLLFYVRCFPYNIFRLRPNYILSLFCLILLVFQYTLLHFQKLYGPKKVIPKFLLPPSYDYSYEEESNVQLDSLAADCAICLTPLHSDPPGGGINVQVEGRMMRTPCMHRYHSACLIEWMQIKHNCPECRADLPPYE